MDSIQKTPLHGGTAPSSPLPFRGGAGGGGGVSPGGVSPSGAPAQNPPTQPSPLKEGGLRNGTTYRILSALLCYPTRNLTAAASELGAMLGDDGLLIPEQISALAPLLDSLAVDDLIDLQERYVSLFDRGRSVSLHLFEHVHGESRDRGQAMVDLQARYAAQGLDISAKELPDYLPMFLEYLSLLPAVRAREELAEPGLIFAALAERLSQREPLYAAPLAILRDLAGVEAEAAAAAATSIAPSEDPDDLEALDVKWAEEQVRFDVPAAPGEDAACPQVAAMVARMHSPLDMPLLPPSPSGEGLGVGSSQNNALRSAAHV